MIAANKEIRVLHVGKFYSPVEGGIENVVQELVNGFCADEEIASSVLVAQRRGPAALDTVQGTTVRRVRSHGVVLGTPMAPGFAAEIARIGRFFDIVHVHVPNPLPFFCNWKALRRHGVRMVVHHHSDIVRPVQRAALTCMKRQEHGFYHSAHQVLVSSNRLLQHSQTLAPFLPKCRVLPLSISLKEHTRLAPARREQVREELGYGPQDVVFFFLGRLVYYKGVHDLLRAAARTSCKLLIGGQGPLGEELAGLARELGISERVTFLGRVDQERLPEIFEASDVFVLPSNAASEAFGVVQLEAMAHGLPVINTSLPTGVPEVSLHGVSGLTVPPRAVDALAAAMQQLAADGALRARLSAGALQRVQEFDRENITEKLRMLYREVMQVPIEDRSAVTGRRWKSAFFGLPHGSKGELPPCSTRSLSISPRQ